MEKEFVPYKLALRLKNLGFDEPCFGLYNLPEQNLGTDLKFGGNSNKYNSKWKFSAPTFSQAFRWFRDEYKLGVQATRDGGEWHFHIVYYGDEHKSSPQRNLTYVEKSSEDYEEVELACLDKLIEIVELDNKLK